MFSLENKYTHKKKKALNFDEPYKEKKKTATYSTADTWKAINEHITTRPSFSNQNLNSANHSKG